MAMTERSSGEKSAMLAKSVEWWRNLRSASANFEELCNCGVEIGAVARDVGVSRTDLHNIAAKRPDAADGPAPEGATAQRAHASSAHARLIAASVYGASNT
jgi:hypothetical protein